jgi:hypothetical protein
MGLRAHKVANAPEQLIPQGALVTGTISTSAVAGPTVAGEAVTHVWIQALGADVRVRSDGEDPTATTGHLLVDKDDQYWAISRYHNSKFIRDAGTDAVLWVQPMVIS